MGVTKEMLKLLLLVLGSVAVLSVEEGMQGSLHDLSATIVDMGDGAGVKSGERVAAGVKRAVGAPPGIKAYWNFNGDFNEVIKPKGKRHHGKDTKGVSTFGKGGIEGKSVVFTGKGTVSLGKAYAGTDFDSKSHTWMLWLKMESIHAAKQASEKALLKNASSTQVAFGGEARDNKGTWITLGKGVGDTLTDGTSTVIPAAPTALAEAPNGATLTTTTKVTATREGVTSKTKAITTWTKVKGWKNEVSSVASAPRYSARGIWYHVASVVANGHTKMYLNGKFVAETYGGKGLSHPVELTVGGLKGKNNWHGEVDELAFWSRGLSGKEVAQAYKLGVEKQPLFVAVCKDLVAPKHGSHGNCPLQLKSGMSCDFKCLPGYKIDAKLKCYDGILNKPKCVGLPCTVPPLKNGHPCGAKKIKSLKHGEKCTPQCKVSYVLRVVKDKVHTEAKIGGFKKKSDERICVAGKLQGAKCKYSGCTLKAPKHGRMGTCKEIMIGGTTCQTKCDKGYIMKNRWVNKKLSTITTCNMRKVSMPECVPGPCYGLNPIPEFGNRGVPEAGGCSKDASVIPGDATKTGQKSGSSCTYGCNKGYTAKGEAKCFAGKYTNVKCTPNPCHNVKAPKNGQMGDCRKSLQHGEKCTPTCDQGYTRLPRPAKGKPRYKYIGRAECNAGVLTPAKCDPDDCTTPKIPNGHNGDCAKKLKPKASCQPTCNEWFKPQAGKMTCGMKKGGVMDAWKCKPDHWVIHGRCTSTKEGRKGLKLTCSKIPKDSSRFKFVLEAANMEGAIFKTVIPEGGTSMMEGCKRYTCLSLGQVMIQSYKTKDCTGKAHKSEKRASPMAERPGMDGIRMTGTCHALTKQEATKMKIKVEHHDDKGGSCKDASNLNGMLGYQDYLTDACMTEFNPTNAKIQYVKYFCRGMGKNGKVGYRTYKDAKCTQLEQSPQEKTTMPSSPLKRKPQLKEDALLVQPMH